jgi:hypothetical protein
MTPTQRQLVTDLIVAELKKATAAVPASELDRRRKVVERIGAAVPGTEYRDGRAGQHTSSIMPP